MAETIFDVRDFGAKGDGVTNDRDAIQAAVDAAAANGGGVVYIPPGVWGIGNGGLNKTDAGIQLRDNVTLRGEGPGESILMVLAGNNESITGVVRTPFDQVTKNVTVEGLTIDGNRDANSSGKVDGFFCGTAPGSTQQDEDITVRNVEIKDCSGYGFDPHEQTIRLTIEDCVSHGNGLDGFTLDFLIDSIIRNNVAYDNDRHGFNVVTSTRNTLLENNDAYDNGGNGITVQRGSEDIPSPHDLIIRGGEISGNALAGILLKFSNDIEVDGVYAHGNMREGLKIYGSSEVTVRNSRFEGNSQAGAGAYNEIYTNSAPDDVTGQTWVSSGNTIVDNTITGGATIQAAYGIRESKETFDSFIDGNTISGMLRAPTLTGPQVRTETPDLRAPVSDFHYSIPAGSYVDIDAGDTVRLALQLIDASGNLVNGGVLPSWLTFDPTTGTISGTPTSATTVHLRVVAADRSDDTEFDAFVLTVSPSGPYNVESGTGEPPPPSGVGTAGDDSLMGTAGSDSLSGLGGRDTIDGAAGADTMAGGDGDDLFKVDNVGDVVSEVTNAGAGGVDTVESSVTIAALWNDVENLTLLGSGHLNATGNNGGNRIVGNTGNNVIDGGLGDDTMIGGAGADTYVVNVTTDVVEELAGGGIDTVQSAVTYTLGANLENLTLTGTVVTGTGNELDNQIMGNASGNRLAGKEGDDTLDGLGGADSLSGSAGRDWLFGRDGDDTLDGGADADRLYGGLGADSLVGDSGFDYVRYDDAAYAGFTVSLADPARNTGVAAGDQFSGVEGLVLGTGNDYGYGDAGDNYIYGMAGHDNLIGGAGADYLHGGAGFDYVRYDEAAYPGFIASLASPSINTGPAAGDTYVEIEGLVLGSGNDYGYGDAAANYIYGMAGADNLIGGAGGDYLHGGAGFDYARYDDTADGVTASLANSAANAGGAAGDTFVQIEGLVLSNGADSGQGDSGANYLYGMVGNDTLDGGAGLDNLHGGPGADRFVFSNAAHSTAAAPDRILDFNAGSGDVIDVSMVDANTGVAGDQAFAWVTSFTNTAGQVRAVYEAGQNRTVLEFDTDGDGQGDDMVIHVVGQVTSSTGFVL